MPIDEYTPTKLPYELSRAADDGGKSDSAGMPHEPTAAHLLQPAAEVGWFLSRRCEAAWERRRRQRPTTTTTTNNNSNTNNSNSNTNKSTNYNDMGL